MIYEEISRKILKAFYTVYNKLGHGFLEKVYENSLVIELMKLELGVQQQKDVPVYYEGTRVGDYAADLLVEDLVILELKAAESMRTEHYAQLTNYLRATDKELGFVLNFGKEPAFKRIFFSNDRKAGGRNILKPGIKI